MVESGELPHYRTGRLIYPTIHLTPKRGTVVQRYAHHSVENLRNGIEILKNFNKEASERINGTILSQS